MATYKEIHGTNIEVVSSDPSNPVEGQLWYNSTSNRVKGFIVSPGSWATSGSLNTARRNICGCGTQTAALGAAGYDGASRPAPQFGLSKETESYNGTSWTEVNDLGLARYKAAMGGSSTSAILFGGTEPGESPSYLARTDKWNGSNWTVVNSMNTGRQDLGGFGASSTAVIAYGGNPGTPPDASYTVESYNGTNWTTVNDMGTRRFRCIGGAGTQTAGFIVAGNSEPSVTSNCELWNGTNWTETTNLPGPARFNSTAGLQTSAITFGGSAPYGFGGADTATWDGSGWTTVGDMNEGRQGMGQGAANNTAAVAFGGYAPPPISSATEEFNSGPATVTLTTS